MGSNRQADSSMKVGRLMELRRGPKSGMIAIIEDIKGNKHDPFYIGKLISCNRQVIWHWKSVLPAQKADEENHPE